MEIKKENWPKFYDTLINAMINDLYGSSGSVLIDYTEEQVRDIFNAPTIKFKEFKKHINNFSWYDYTMYFKHLLDLTSLDKKYLTLENIDLIIDNFIYLRKNIKSEVELFNHFYFVLSHDGYSNIYGNIKKLMTYALNSKLYLIKYIENKIEENYKYFLTSSVKNPKENEHKYLIHLLELVFPFSFDFIKKHYNDMCFYNFMENDVFKNNVEIQRFCIKYMMPSTVNNRIKELTNRKEKNKKLEINDDDVEALLLKYHFE